MSPHSQVDSLDGFAVLDAFGIRIGFVNGLVRNPEGRIAFVCVAASRAQHTRRTHLLPIRYVSNVDEEKRLLQLARLDRITFSEMCPEFNGSPAVIPDIRHFPQSFGPPNPATQEQLNEL